MNDHPLYRELPDSFDARVPGPPPQPARPRPAWGQALTLAVFFGVLGAVLWGVVPKFAAVYRQIHVSMPDSTELLLSASGFVCAYPWAWALLGVVCPALLAPPLKRGGAWGEAVFIILVVFTTVFIVGALFAPLTCCTFEGIGRKR